VLNPTDNAIALLGKIGLRLVHAKILSSVEDFFIKKIMGNKKEVYRFSGSEIRKINHKHILGFDKWFRMCAGFGSQLIGYKNDIAYLEVRNTEKKRMSDSGLAAQVINSWMYTIENRMPEAHGFVLYLYRTSRREGEPEGKFLVGIFSGMLPRIKKAN
jgi:hypothetical protein